MDELKTIVNVLWVKVQFRLYSVDIANEQQLSNNELCT